MRVEQLTVRGFGPFDELELQFQPRVRSDKADLHILTGQNGSGKSSLLYALAAALAAPRLDMMDWELPHSRWHGPDALVCLKLDDDLTCVGPSVRSQGLPGDLSKLAGVGVLGGAPHHSLYGNVEAFRRRCEELMPSGGFREAAFAYAGTRNVGSFALAAIEEVKEHPLVGCLSFSRASNSKNLAQWIANTKTKAALAAQRGDQDAVSRRNAALVRIENAVSSVVEQRIQFELQEEPLAVRLVCDGKALEFDVLPDGLKSIMSWIADLLMRLDRLPWVNDVPVLDRPFVLLLDEIDVHLHPKWQRKVLPVVQSLFPAAQIILSTHSPFVVNSVADAWVYPLEIENGKVILKAATPSRAGSSYEWVLAQTFGVDQDFDDATEAELAKLRALKSRLLAQDGAPAEELRTLMAALAQKGPELRELVGMEARQLLRLTKIDLMPRGPGE